MKDKLIYFIGCLLVIVMLFTGCCCKDEGVTDGKSALPLGIFFVADVSGSMGFDGGVNLAAMQDGLIAFIQNMDALKDYAELIPFASNVAPDDVYFFNPINKDDDSNGTLDIIDAVNSLSAGGGTNILAGVNLAVTDAIPHVDSFSTAVIVFTDGSDSSNYTTVKQTAIDNSIPIYTIVLGEKLNQDLKDLAEETGGKYYETADNTTLTEIYNEIYEEIDQNRKFGIW